MKYNINRRKFLELFSCSCFGLALPSCSTVPITKRRQLSIIPESRINRQASDAYEKFRMKAKLITKGNKKVIVYIDINTYNVYDKQLYDENKTLMLVGTFLQSKKNPEELEYKPI